MAPVRTFPFRRRRLSPQDALEVAPGQQGHVRLVPAAPEQLGDEPGVAGGVAELQGVGGTGVVGAGQTHAPRPGHRADVVEVVGDVPDGRAGLLGGQRHHAQAARRAQLHQQVVGEVGGVRAQRAGRGAGAQRRGLGHREGTADGLRGGAGEVGDHSEAVHLPDDLLAEPGQPRLARPAHPGQRQGAQAEGVQGAQDAEAVAEGGGARGTGQHGDPAAVAGVDGLPRVVGQAQALRVGPHDRLDQVELLQRGTDRPVPVEGLGQVQRPQQRAHVPRAQPRHVGVDCALAQLQVVPGQVLERPRQAVAAVGDGVGGQHGERAAQGLVVGVGHGRVGLRRKGLRGERHGQVVEPTGLGTGVQVVLEVCHDGLRTVVVRYGHRRTERKGLPGGWGVRGYAARGFPAYGGGATGPTGCPATREVTAQPSSSSSDALDGSRVAWSPRATSSAASSTRTAFFQVSLARSAWDQPRSSSSAIRFG
ncbi:hypothetical protein SVIOM342S_05904 [Streptomyces violaceorubidus]